MFKKISLSLLVLALLISTGLPLAARADNDRSEKNRNQNSAQIKNSKHEQENERENESEKNYKNDERLPSGLRNAPGIEKRVENGKGLPFGWWFKLFGGFNWPRGNSTSTNATTTPWSFNLTGLTATAGTSTATISWQTNRLADSKLFYSTSADVTASSSQVSNTSLISNHNLVLSGLNPDTTYYYFVTSTTAGNQTATSSIVSFKTSALPVADTEAPNIIFSTVVNVTETSARFIWVTNEASNSKAWISTSTPLNLSLTPDSQNTALAYYHDLTVNGLTASTTYNYVLGSADAANNLATSTGTITTH